MVESESLCQPVTLHGGEGTGQEAGGKRPERGNRNGFLLCRLTFVRRVPSLLLRLPPTGCIGCLDDVEGRGATGRLVPTPTAGDMDRAGTFGGGPGSMPGERRCELRVEFMSIVEDLLCCNSLNQSITQSHHADGMRLGLFFPPSFFWCPKSTFHSAK